MSIGAGTLDDVFRSNVRRTPHAPALLDPPDRETFTDGPYRALTYAEADRAVAVVAATLGLFGLPPGAAVAVQLPNCVESVVALLAIWRAGLVATPLPLLWRKTEAATALAGIGAQALICCGRVASVDHGELAREVAAETFSIKVVAGFGPTLPDGIVPLDGAFADAPSDAPPAPAAAGDGADSIALVTFDAMREGPAPVARTHTELLVSGLAPVMEAGIPRHASILATPLGSSFAALATTVMPWLLTGGTLALHQPFDPAVFAAQMQDRFDAVVLPGPLIAALADAGIIGANAEGRAGAHVALWRSPERQAESPPWVGHTPLVDVLAFGETGLIALRRESDGRARMLAEGPMTAPSATEGAPVVMTVTRTAGGAIALNGPTVTSRRFPLDEAEGLTETAAYIDTGYPCTLDPRTRVLTLDGPPPGLVGVGGYRFALGELQDIVGRVDSEGVLVALPDGLAGQKLAGTAADTEAMRAALAALGVNSLVSAAFRGRSGRAPAA